MKFLRSQIAGKLIGALMLIIGLGAFIHVAKITIDEKSLKDWVPHYAQMKSAVLNTYENDKGRKSYFIDVSYVFEWDGSSFIGTRYRLHDKPSHSAHDNGNTLQDLLLSKQNGGQYPIFVNPKNPQQSAIFNTVHPKAKSSSLFFGFLFSILGCYTVFKPKLFRKRSAG